MCRYTSTISTGLAGHIEIQDNSILYPGFSAGRAYKVFTGAGGVSEKLSNLLTGS